MERATLGLSPELRTPPTRSRRRTSRWGQAIEHGPRTTRSTSHQSILQSCSSLTTCDLASHDDHQASRNWLGRLSLPHGEGGVSQALGETLASRPTQAPRWLRGRRLLSALSWSPGRFGTNTPAGAKAGGSPRAHVAALQNSGSGAAVDADALAIGRKEASRLSLARLLEWTTRRRRRERRTTHLLCPA